MINSPHLQQNKKPCLLQMYSGTRFQYYQILLTTVKTKLPQKQSASSRRIPPVRDKFPNTEDRYNLSICFFI